MAGEIYKKPILFSIVAALVILSGTVVMVFYPMLTDEMHPKLESLKPLTALELAGRDIYQREGCVNCHSQTVRPLKTEVLRYGEYSKAGEFAYDRPFLWGSKRTGPDLARIGRKYPDAWHYRHFANPQSFHAKSNMPSYGWMKDNTLDGESIKSHMNVMGMPYTDEDIVEFNKKNELDALVAYMQVLGTSVKKPKKKLEISGDAENPMAGNAEAIVAGAGIYEEFCVDCHEEAGKGDIGPALTDKTFLYNPEDVSSSVYFQVIANGTEEGQNVAGRTAKGDMPDFSSDLSEEKIWQVITYIRSLQKIENPMAGKPEAITKGAELYEENCVDCHEKAGKGDIGPSLADKNFLYQEKDADDSVYFTVIANGTEEDQEVDGRKAKGEMPDFGTDMSKDEIWSVIAYIRSLQK